MADQAFPGKKKKEKKKKSNIRIGVWNNGGLSYAYLRLRDRVMCTFCWLVGNAKMIN